MSPQPRLDDARNFRRVDSGLCTSGQPTEAELAAAASEGLEVVINLALHDDPRYSLADERRSVELLGMTYVHIPVQFSAPTHEDFGAFCAAMETHAGRRMLVHCAANYRVTAFLGLYRAVRQGLPRETAFAVMKTVWEPDEVWVRFIDDELASHGVG